MHIATTGRRALVAGLLVVLAAGWLLPSTATDTSVTIGSINGQPTVEGRTMRVPTGDVTVAGTSTGGVIAPPVVADAGDSAFIEAGKAARVLASASGGDGSYTFAWTFGGSDERFADPTAFDTTFDTTGLDGPVVLDLRVTDGAGASSSDSVKLFVWTLTTTTVVDETQDTGPGVPEEDIDPALSGTVDGETYDYPFSVPAGALTLDLELSWETYEASAGVNDFDLRVDDPSDAQDENTSAAGQAMPEKLAIAGPAAGAWSAIVQNYLSAQDTFTLKGVVTAAPADPVPSIVAGPFTFPAGATTQPLAAAVTGGTSPYEIVWDFDRDGSFDAEGAEVTANLPAGTHMVLVKVTDAAGYERRVITPVRIGVAAPNEGVVVVGVSDSGLNVYHRDFGAETYRDEAIKNLTGNFTKHPSTYLPGYPAAAPAKNLTLNTAFATGKLYPAADEAEWTKAEMPNNTLVWFPGTKIIGAIDASDTGPVNGNADTTPLLDDDGHGTASASVAVGNLYGYCPQCLLFFVEGLSGDTLLYDYDFIDLASNSHGTLGNVGFAGLFDAAQPKEDAERGQIALYAAGNGNENAFVTPEQTYTSESLGPDWLVRVGAVSKTTRKPIIGTGKPVDIASWGIGASSGPESLPAADNTSPGGTTTHSGTSAATPYSAGVFGTVLGTIRNTLGDTKPGQKNPAGEPTAAVVAKGTPVPGSPYLADGELTRRELTEAVFKTAEHDTSNTIGIYPPTTPGSFPAQYLIEGYGIVEPASGLRALDVLLGTQPMPERPAEDDFFAADSALRDELWGTWSGGGESSAPQTTAAVGDSPVSANAFRGVTAAQVSTWDAAWKVLVDRAGPFQLDVVADAAAAMAAGGVTYYPHAVGDCNAQAVEEYLDTADTAGDVECSTFGTAGIVGVDLATWTAKDGLTRPIPTGTAVDGVLYVHTETPASTEVTVTLSAAGRTLGQASVIVESLGALDGWIPVPIELTTTDGATVGESLSISAAMDLTPSWSFGLEDDRASFFTFAVPDGGGGGDTGGGGEAGTLAVAITSPADDTTVDPTRSPTLPLSGTVSFADQPAEVSSTRYYPFWASTEAVECADQVLLSSPGGADAGCSQTFQSLAPTGVAEFVESYPLEASALPVRVGRDQKVSGTLVYSAAAVDPARTVTVQLVGTPSGGTSVVLGEATVSATVIGLLGLGSEAEFPFEFSATGPATGVPLDALSLDVRIDRGQTGTTMERENGRSFVDLPLETGAAADGGRVEVALDDPTFASPAVATLGDAGTWGHTLDTTGLADGQHTVFVRAVQGEAASAVDTLPITVARATTGGGAGGTSSMVQVRLVGDKEGSPTTGWVDAVGTAEGGSLATWSAVLPDVSMGTYRVEARMIAGADEVARAATTRIRVR